MVTITVTPAVAQIIADCATIGLSRIGYDLSFPRESTQDERSQVDVAIATLDQFGVQL